VTSRIGRYINREVLLSWLAVVAALMVILMSHRFAGFLGRAASGELPLGAVGSLLALSSVQYLVIIAPIAFFLSILLALGRLYKDSEMAAMMACGVGPLFLYRALLWLILPIMLMVGWLSMVGAPMASAAMDRVQQAAQAEARLSVFEAGAFRRIPGSDGVFYAEGETEGVLKGVFVQGYEGEQQVVIRADRARIESGERGQRYLVLEDGYRHELTPGQSEMQRTRFQRHGIELPPAQEASPGDARESRSLRQLLASGSAEDLAEFHWRLAMPIGAFVLAFLAVPLSRTSPRQGRYARLFAGILVYLVYSNMLATGQAWLESERLPAVLGLWWVHASLLLFALILLFRQTGGTVRWLGRSARGSA